MTSAIPRYLASRLAFLLILLLGVFQFAGCSDNAGVTSGNEDNGELVVGLTDAPGDFISYRVGVKSLQFKRSNGTVVETLPNATEIDFAQYVEATEFITTATVPAGKYDEVSLVLDYSNAQITVEAEDGGAAEATVVNADGNPVTGDLTMQLKINDRDGLVVRPGQPAHITLDFDLAASHRVDLAQSPALVTVEPLLLADTQLSEPKEHRVRGLLKTVDTDASAFVVQIRPRFSRNHDFGSLRVYTGDETAYEIDGETATGATGLEQLATLPAGAAIVALGKLNPENRHFEASQVYAGGSVDWGDKDLLTGHVVARDGNTLTVRGATVERADRRAVFNDNITVTVGDATQVTRQGVADQEPTIADISVGQRITVAGKLSSDDPNQLDATEGSVRLLYTTLNGTVKQVSPLVIELQRIDARRVSLFDFTGTGAGSDNDADPANYEVDTGALTLGGVNAGDPIKLRGFVNAFGAAPADFIARSIADVANTPATLKVSWNEPGATAPFSSLSAEAITVNLQEPTLDKAHVLRGGVALDLPPAGVDPILTGDSDQRGIYAIAHGRRVEVYGDFASFEAALSDKLDGVTVVRSLGAHGRFDNAATTLNAGRINVRIQ